MNNKPRKLFFTGLVVAILISLSAYVIFTLKQNPPKQEKGIYTGMRVILGAKEMYGMQPPTPSKSTANKPSENAMPWVKVDRNSQIYADMVIPEFPFKPLPYESPLPREAVLRLGSTRWKNGADITSLLFSLDDKSLIAGSIDKTLSWWDVETGKEIKRINNWSPASSLIDFSSQNFFVSSSGFFPTFVMRNSIDGSPITRIIGARKLKGGHQTEFGFGFSAKRNLIAVQTSDYLIQLWDATNLEPRTRFKGLESVACHIGFSADENQVFALTNSGEYFAWDLDSESLASKLNIEKFVSCDFSPNKTMLVSCGNGRAGLRNVAKTGQLKVIPIPGNCVKFSPDGKFIAFGTSSGMVALWDIAKAKKIFTTTMNFQPVHALAFSHDQKKLAAADMNGQIRLWSLETLKELFPDDGHSGGIKSLSFTPDGERLLSVGLDGETKLWQLNTSKLEATFKIGSFPMQVLAISDSEAIVTNFKGAIIWDFSTGKAKSSIHEDSVYYSGYNRCQTTLSRDGSRLAIPIHGETAEKSPASFYARVFKTQNGERIGDFLIPEKHGGLAFSPDNAKLAITSAGNASQTLICYEISSGKKLFQMPIPTKMAYTSIPIFTPGGNLIVGGGSYEDRGMAVRKSESGQVVYFPWCMGIIHGQLMTSPDGVTIADLDWRDRSVVEVGEAPWMTPPNLNLKGHKGEVTALAFSNGGRYLASGGKDSTILIWDLFKGEAFEDPAKPMHAKEATLAEAPIDGSPIVAFGFEGNIKSAGLATTVWSPESSLHGFSAGKKGLALRLNAAERNEITIGETDSISPGGAWTVEFWFSIGGSGNWKKSRFFQIFDCDLLAMDLRDMGNPVAFYRFQNRGGHGSFQLSKHGLIPDRWNHVAFTNEGHNGKFRIFLNGNQKFESSFRDLSTDIGEIKFGRGNESTEEDERYVLIDDFKIYAFAKRPEIIAKEAGFAEDPNQ